MDVSYINTILSTSSVKFKTLIDGEPFLLFVKTGDSSLDIDGNLIVTDCIEEKTFTIPANADIIEVHGRDEIFPPNLEDYQKFVKENAKKIQRNNKVFEEEFEGYRLLSQNIDKTSENFYIIKEHRPAMIIAVMEMLGITDLANYYEGGERAVAVLRKRSLELLHTTETNTKERLNNEKEKFIAEGDTESVEEIDIILEMIDSEVKATTFETLSCIEDIYTQWPPILLPVPLERHALFN